MKTLFLLSFILFVSACSKPSEELSSQAGIDNGRLSEISKSFCGVGEKLVELNLDPVPLQFEYLNTPGTLLGFVSNSSCVVTKDINENWGTGLFGLQIHDTCLPSGSLWKITEAYNANDTRYFKLDSADPVGLPTMDMWGSRNLNATYVRDHYGLRVMKCLSTGSKPTH